jgi:hypothetical protein
MKQAAAAARLLEMAAHPMERRALETAVAVCYARPWGKNPGLPWLDPKWRPDLGLGRTLHNRLVKLRNQVYAHTNLPKAGRSATAIAVVDANSFREGGWIAEGWKPLDRDTIPSIIEVCEPQASRFLIAVVSPQLEEIGERPLPPHELSIEWPSEQGRLGRVDTLPPVQNRTGERSGASPSTATDRHSDASEPPPRRGGGPEPVCAAAHDAPRKARAQDSP